MESLQKTIYKMLPPNIKHEIINNPSTYAEYADVISRLRQEVRGQITSNIRGKIKLSNYKLQLMSVLLSIYYHIRSNPPQMYSGQFKSLEAWETFSYVNYPQYEEYIDDVSNWPKSMFLIYYTYKLCYEKWYNLRLDSQLKRYALPFNRKNDKLIDYIYQTYHHLNKSITLEEFRFFGY